jgi:predicted AAA+ superfamily ATPase
VITIKALACEFPHELGIPLSRFSRGPNFADKAGRILDLYEGFWEGRPLAEVLSLANPPCSSRFAGMIPRFAQGKVTSALARFPVVALLGPRQVGKTTLALELAGSWGGAGATYLDLESPRDQARLTDPLDYLESQAGRLVILDEIHRAPGIFEVLRGIVDARRRQSDRSGHFLVLGSASLDLMRQSSESLAGRIQFVELTPVLPAELPDPADLEGLWLRGGLPESLLAEGDGASLEWREAFIRTYLERDIPMLGPRIPAHTLRRLWTMLAHNQGQQINAARLASGLGISGQTVGRYVDLLSDLLLLRRLMPWTGNVGKRLTRTPKAYLRDSGIVHALLGIQTRDDLLGHPVCGASWEGMVLEALIAEAGSHLCSFYRTSAGAEIDLVVEVGSGRRLAVEVKRTSAPKAGRGFRIALEDLGASAAAVIHSGAARFSLGEGVEAVPVSEAVAWLKEGLGA